MEIDIFSAFHDVVADPGAFGFSNVTDPCFDGTTVSGDPDEYLFWDGVHPTTKGHRVLAGVVFEELVTREPLVHSDTATVEVSVSDATTPAAFIDGNLYVAGTICSDTIVVRRDWFGRVDVRVNGNRVGRYDLEPGARVVVFGQDGNDWIYAGRLNRAAILNGDGGNDILVGGCCDDVLYGGDGNDVLFGGRGNDALFGNDGHDWLFGQLGDDELDGGNGYDWLFGYLGTDVLKNGERSFA
jgi:hypothetical protein